MNAPLRRIGSAILALTFCVGAAPVSASTDGLPDSVDQLIESAENGSTPGQEDLLAILSAGPVGATTDLIGRLDQRGAQAPSRAAIDSIEASLAGIGSFVRSRRNEQSAESWHDEARVALEYITHRGSSADLEDAFTVCSPHKNAAYAMVQRTSDLLTRTIEALLIRDRASFPRLERLWPEAPTAVRRSLLDALGDSRDVEAAPLLTRLLGTDVSNDILVLIHLAKAGRHRLAPLDEGSYERIRVYLRHQEPKLRASAAQALGRLDDQSSVQELIGMLEDNDAKVRVGVHFALKLLTAMTLDASTRPWISWYESERRWYIEERPELFRRLVAIRSEEMAPMLRELAAHQLYRRELGELLVPFLDDPNPEIVRMVIAAMQGLRADTAIDALSRCRDEHTSDSVVKQATHAIWVITGITPERQVQKSRG
tara:strand:+ start:2530 stop:3810 length:1281 start_codon:yes stop_codon:yes gene_type:complete